MSPHKSYPVIAIILSLAGLASTVSLSANSLSVEKLAKAEPLIPHNLTQKLGWSAPNAKWCIPIPGPRRCA